MCCAGVCSVQDWVGLHQQADWGTHTQARGACSSRLCSSHPPPTSTHIATHTAPQGRTYKLRVKPGPDGLRQFKEQVRP